MFTTIPKDGPHASLTSIARSHSTFTPAVTGLLFALIALQWRSGSAAHRLRRVAHHATVIGALVLVTYWATLC